MEIPIFLKKILILRIRMSVNIYLGDVLKDPVWSHFQCNIKFIFCRSDTNESGSNAVLFSRGAGEHSITTKDIMVNEATVVQFDVSAVLIDRFNSCCLMFVLHIVKPCFHIHVQGL